MYLIFIILWIADLIVVTLYKGTNTSQVHHKYVSYHSRQEKVYIPSTLLQIYVSTL